MTAITATRLCSIGKDRVCVDGEVPEPSAQGVWLIHRYAWSAVARDSPNLPLQAAVRVGLYVELTLLCGVEGVVANSASSGNDHSELLNAQADQATSAQTTPKTPKMIRNRVISSHPSNLKHAASDRGEWRRS
jgi:hypothetical protein